MVVLTAETCWAFNEYWINNKISGIKLVFSLLKHKFVFMLCYRFGIDNFAFICTTNTKSKWWKRKRGKWCNVRRTTLKKSITILILIFKSFHSLDIIEYFRIWNLTHTYKLTVFYELLYFLGLAWLILGKRLVKKTRFRKEYYAVRCNM